MGFRELQTLSDHLLELLKSEVFRYQESIEKWDRIKFYLRMINLVRWPSWWKCSYLVYSKSYKFWSFIDFSITKGTLPGFWVLIFYDSTILLSKKPYLLYMYSYITKWYLVLEFELEIVSMLERLCHHFILWIL